MRRWAYLALLLIPAGIVNLGLGCSTTESDDDGGLGPGNGDPEIAFLEHLDKGCAGEERDPQRVDVPAFLKGYTYDEGILVLTIRFDANCCPGFCEDVVIDGNEVQIDLADTLSNCRCTCTFENDFSFACSGADELFIRFRATDEPGQSFTSGVDTLLVLSR
jgi:hypothetical protein